MGITEALEMLTTSQSVLGAIGTVFEKAGITALVLVLILGFVFFVPTIVASMRHIMLRIPVCILNVVAIALFFLKFYIPILVWLVLMITAITSKPSKNKQNVVPTIEIITNSTNEKK